MEEISKLISRHLLNAGAVKLSVENPFEWASGWKSPIYCDNRITLSFPHIRNDISKALQDLITQNFPGHEVIAGVATAGIPQAAIVADRLQKSMIYVRPKPKDHGMKNQIEGKIEAGKKCVLIEDLISTGGSSLKAAQALKEDGVEVMGMVAIFTYGFPIADENFKNAGVACHTLSNYNDLLEVALSQDIIQSKDIEALKAWRANPSEWGK